MWLTERLLDMDGFVCLDWIEQYLKPSSFNKPFFTLNEIQYLGVPDEGILTLKTIRSEIIENMAAANKIKSIRISQKWYYIANYFNRSVDRYIQHCTDRNMRLELIEINPIGL